MAPSVMDTAFAHMNCYASKPGTISQLLLQPFCEVQVLEICKKTSSLGRVVVEALGFKLVRHITMLSQLLRFTSGHGLLGKLVLSWNHD